MKDAIDDGSIDGAMGFDGAKILAKLSRFYRLLFWIVTLFLFIGFLFVLCARPLGFLEYTASATIGPTDADTGSNFISAMSGLSGLGGLSGKSILSTLSGMGSGGGFDEYTQLLTSTRLAQVLAEKENLLPVIFDTKWDQGNHRWDSRDDAFHRTVDFVKRLLNIPVKPHPDVDDLANFFATHLNVGTSYTSSFVDVSFTFDDPTESTRILSLILYHADELMRQDKYRDVSARMKYLERQLPKITDVNERESAISVLSTQQQMMVMIQADKHYAAAFVDTPHASLSPTAPNIGMLIFLGIVCSVATWCALIFLLPEDHWILTRHNRLPWARVSQLARSGTVNNRE